MYVHTYTHTQIHAMTISGKGPYRKRTWKGIQDSLEKLKGSEKCCNFTITLKRRKEAIW